MTRRTRLLITSLLLMAVFIGVPVLLIWRAVKQEKLDRALIAAIMKDDAVAVVSLLKRGADPNAKVSKQGAVSFHSTFR